MHPYSEKRPDFRALFLCLSLADKFHRSGLAAAALDTEAQIDAEGEQDRQNEAKDLSFQDDYLACLSLYLYKRFYPPKCCMLRDVFFIKTSYFRHLCNCDKNIGGILVNRFACLMVQYH